MFFINKAGFRMSGMKPCIRKHWNKEIPGNHTGAGGVPLAKRSSGIRMRTAQYRVNSVRRFVQKQYQRTVSLIKQFDQKAIKITI
jgi:hypothetical protein